MRVVTTAQIEKSEGHAVRKGLFSSGGYTWQWRADVRPLVWAPGLGWVKGDRGGWVRL